MVIHEVNADGGTRITHCVSSVVGRRGGRGLDQCDGREEISGGVAGAEQNT